MYILLKLNPGPTNNDDQSTISTYCSRGRCAALSTRSAVLSIAANVNRLPFHNTSHRIPVHTTSMRRRDYDRSYMIANLRWLDTVFQGQYLPSLSINYVAINKVLEKLPPQLYLIKMKICYDQGCNDIGVVIATK